MGRYARDCGWKWGQEASLQEVVREGGLFPGKGTCVETQIFPDLGAEPSGRANSKCWVPEVGSRVSCRKRKKTDGNSSIEVQHWCYLEQRESQPTGIVGLPQDRTSTWTGSFLCLCKSLLFPLINACVCMLQGVVRGWDSHADSSSSRPTIPPISQYPQSDGLFTSDSYVLIRGN